MKQIILTLCVFILLPSLADAARFYKCIDKDGNTIITNTTPPPGAICEGGWGQPNESRPSERQNIQSGQASGGTGECLKELDKVAKHLDNVNYFIDAGESCRATDGIEVALNLLGICEDKCRLSRAQMDKIAEWKRKLTVGLAEHARQCGASPSERQIEGNRERERQQIESERLEMKDRLTQNDERKLDELYNRAMSKSEMKGVSVGGAADYICLAEVINKVKLKGKSINPRFWDLVEDAIGGRRKYSVGGLLNAVQRAASIQSIDTTNISSCTSAMLHSLPRR